MREAGPQAATIFRCKNNASEPQGGPRVFPRIGTAIPLSGFPVAGRMGV